MKISRGKRVVFQMNDNHEFNFKFSSYSINPQIGSGECIRVKN